MALIFLHERSSVMATRGTGADLSRNPDLARQTVKQGDYSLTYDDNG